MEQYTQYLEYFKQYEAMEEDEAESSVKHTKRYIARDRELAEDKLRRDYFGDENTPPMVPGTNNDLNVLYGSPLFDGLLADKAPEAPFQVNEKTYEKDDDVVVLENSETKEEDVKEDESDHNKERYTFEDDDDDGEFDDLD
ncbi:reverse transcriptase domain-containing protein [Tanacetum coccineum]